MSDKEYRGRGNFVCLTPDGVGMVVTRKEWEWWPMIKTTFSDDQIKDMDTFMKECHKFHSSLDLSMYNPKTDKE